MITCVCLTETWVHFSSESTGSAIGDILVKTLWFLMQLDWFLNYFPVLIALSMKPVTSFRSSFDSNIGGTNLSERLQVLFAILQKWNWIFVFANAHFIWFQTAVLDKRLCQVICCCPICSLSGSLKRVLQAQHLSIAMTIWIPPKTRLVRFLSIS